MGEKVCCSVGIPLGNDTGNMECGLYGSVIAGNMGIEIGMSVKAIMKGLVGMCERLLVIDIIVYNFDGMKNCCFGFFSNGIGNM
jgi:hypothetical protein